jgi:preprotein translocase subunit SecF
MQFIKPDINIDFIGKRKLAYCISLLLIAITIVVLFINKGPKYGIDFSGGTLIQVKFSGPTSAQLIKSGLATIGIEKASVQSFGDASANEFLLRTDKLNSTTQGNTQKLQSALAGAAGVDVEIRRVEMVGPQVGKDLREKASFAFFYALLFITIYISGRFEMKWILSGVMAGALMASVYFLSLFQVSIPFLISAALIVTLFLFWILGLKYAMGAIAALIHDVLITVGLFTLFGKEFTLPIVAALLTIVGYSLNDTIIVFDRIRENIRKVRKSPFDTIINRSINETLSRTLLTSLTTLMVLLALFVWGGGIIHDFAFTMMVGVLVGTYSSMYVASPILLAWEERKK